MKNLPKLEPFLLAAYALALGYLAFQRNGTGDDGDSVQHYLFARHAFAHPANFFDHWAKPIWVMLMSLPAQGGFVAVKLANVGLLVLTYFFTWKIAERLGFRSGIWPLLLGMSAPMGVYFTLSGLTEPMFACWLAAGIFWAISGRVNLSKSIDNQIIASPRRLVGATLWLSFLPFVRSEGLVILCVFGAYLLAKKAWRLLPLMAVGHVVLAVAGWSVHRDLLWVFRKIPYRVFASGDVGYGHGAWNHFIVHFPDVCGPFLSLLTVAGLLLGAARLWRYLADNQTFGKEELWLVYGIFVGYFAAHTMFWALGIFNSFGLMRVMLGAICPLALIAGRAAEWLVERGRARGWAVAVGLFLGAGAVWNLFYERNWRDSLGLNPDQIIADVMAKKYANVLREYSLFTQTVYPTVPFQRDKFDRAQWRQLQDLFDGSPLPEKYVALWDHRFAVYDARIPLEKLDADPRFALLEKFDWNEEKNKFALYVKRREAVADSSGTLLEAVDHLFILDKKQEYSPGFRRPVSDFRPGQTIRLRCNLWADVPRPNEPNLVVEYQDKSGKQLDWKSRPLLPPDFQAGRWQPFSFEHRVETEKFPDAILKIYLWSPNEAAVFGDLLRFEIF